MTLRIVQLGGPRKRNGGLRIGTVRRPPRGVPRNRYASDRPVLRELLAERGANLE